MSQARRYPRLIELITLIGVLLYVGRSLYFAHSALSIGDEGAYLYKGLAFARGEYRPFQEYGFWTNKAPLAFLIPGYIQLWFGPGLREGRYFAVLISILMLAGLWITANRLGGKKWAAIVVWVYALSDPHLATYSQALSQGLVACLMSWMLVCVLGDNRPLWQLVLGSIISVLVVMTRQNMVFVPPILILYVFWQYGSKAGWWAITASIVTSIAFLAIYWPGILQVWAGWLPSAQTPFLDNFRILGTPAGAFHGPSTLARWQAFAIGVRDHFFVLCGSLCGVMLWIHKERWKNPDQFKPAVFLGVLFFFLFLLHMWGSIFNDFCSLCFTSYQMFFSMTGLLFVLVVFSNGISESKRRFPLLALPLVLTSSVLGLSYYPVWSDWLLDAVHIPRIGASIAYGRIGFASLRDVLTYAFDLESDLQKRVASILGGGLVGITILVISLISFQLLKKGSWRYSRNLTIFSTFMVAALTLSSFLNFSQYHPSCSTNFLAYYERAGKALAEITPPNSLLYWKGSGRQLALLLYVEDVRYFPPQISAGAGYLIGDSDHLLKFGLYNDELDQQWKESADILMIWRFFPTVLFEEFQDQTKYQPIPFDMGEIRNCEHPLFLFKRQP